MEPESSKEAAKQPMEAEAGDPEDPRDLGNSLNPPVILLQMPNLTCKPFFLLVLFYFFLLQSAQGAAHVYYLLIAALG
jgi:hypothetical protein